MKLDLVNTIAIAAGVATIAAVYYQLKRTPGSPVYQAPGSSSSASSGSSSAGGGGFYCSEP